MDSHLDDSTFENVIAAFDHWLSSATTLEPKYIDPRYILCMEEKYLGLLKGKKVGLKILGEKIGVSSARARIIVKNGDKKVENYIKLHLPHLQQTMKKPIEAPDNGAIVNEKFVHYLLMDGLNKHLSS